MALSHAAGEDKAVSDIPVTSSWDVDYLLPADGDGGVVGSTEPGSSSLWGEGREGKLVGIAQADKAWYAWCQIRMDDKKKEKAGKKAIIFFHTLII